MPNLLENTEQARNMIQVALNAQKSARERNRLGQFATPTELAVQMSELGKEQLAGRCPVRFMDPALGTGVFFYAACKVFGNRIKAASGYETDLAVAERARELWNPFGLDVRLQDFCMASAPTKDAQKTNLILCNPPYVRHHHRARSRKRAPQEDDESRILDQRTGWTLLLLSHACP